MFTKFLHAQPGQTAFSDTSHVNVLLQRVGESVAVEDRRAALLELRDALADDPAAQAALASLGFNTLCGAIQNDRDDPLIVRTCLECIVSVTGERGAGPQVRRPRRLCFYTQVCPPQCSQPTAVLLRPLIYRLFRRLMSTQSS